MKEYRDVLEKSAKLEKILDAVENIRLLKIAESRNNSNNIPLESLVAEEGFTMEELEELAESVELE